MGRNQETQEKRAGMVYKALLLFFLFEYARPGNFIPGMDALHVNSLIPIGVALGALFGRSPVSRGQFFQETNTRFMCVFLAMLVVSVMFAIVTSNAFEVTKNVFSYMLIYMALVRQLGDVDRIKGVMKTLVLVHVLIIGLTPQMLLATDRVSVNAGAFLGDGNDFALSVNVCLPFSLFLMLEASTTRTRIFWGLIVLLLVMSIVVTQSRGGTIALVIVGLYFWAKSRRKALTAAMAACAVVLVVYAAPPGYFERIKTTTNTEEDSAAGRITAWKTSFKIALGSPLLGAGAGNFPVAFGSINGGRWMTAHSIYFLLLGELGFPGLILLLALIFANLAANARLQRKLKNHASPRAPTMASLLTCTSASLIGFAIAGAFLSASYYPHIYVVCGLLSATRYVVRRELAGQTEVKHALRPSPGAALVPAAVRHGAVSPQWRPRPVGAHSVR